MFSKLWNLITGLFMTQPPVVTGHRVEINRRIRALMEADKASH